MNREMSGGECELEVRIAEMRWMRGKTGMRLEERRSDGTEQLTYRGRN